MISHLPYLPPRELSPNARCHYMQKWRAGKHFEHDAWALAINERMKKFAPFTNPVVNVTFIVKEKRIRDRDNAIASLKSALDGIAIALDFDDSIVKWGSVEWEVDKSRAPMIVIEVKDEAVGNET